jgi:hypothetical protein
VDKGSRSLISPSDRLALTVDVIIDDGEGGG